MALLPFSSKLIADVGISMGDEGKGRLISEVARELRQTTGQDDIVGVVMKVNGGSNSGHTAGGLKLNLLPAGVVEDQVAHLAIGAGVVADPRKFLWEMIPLEARGFRIKERLVIDQRTMVSDLTHRLLDLAWEDYRSNILAEDPRGSTGRGITPAYQDETGQWQIGYGVFAESKDRFVLKFRQRIQRALKIIRYVCEVSPETWQSFFHRLSEAEQRANQESINAGLFPPEEFDFTRFAGPNPYTLNEDLLLETYWEAGQKLLPCVTDVREIVLRNLRENKFLIGEFGQSFWLDKRHGFAPNVTASHTYTPELFHSAGIPHQPVHTFGVCKAYDTKVGTHIFLTEMEEEVPLTARLKKIEFGTSTGRQRMVGWFDAVEKGDALRYGGFQDLMINKLDALTADSNWSGPLKICYAYSSPSGEIYYHVPRNDAVRANLRPLFHHYPTWTEDLSPIRSYQKLPPEAKNYFAGMVHALITCAYHGEPWPAILPNVRYIGVGPDPSQIITDLPSTNELLAAFSPPEITASPKS